MDMTDIQIIARVIVRHGLVDNLRDIAIAMLDHGQYDEAVLILKAIKAIYRADAY